MEATRTVWPSRTGQIVRGASSIASAPFRWAEAAIRWAIMRPLSRLWALLDAYSYAFEETLARKIISVALFPVCMVAAFVIGFHLVERGLTPHVFPVLAISFIVMGLVFAPLERLMPFSRRWLHNDQDTSVDLLMFATMIPWMALWTPAKIFLTAWLVGWIHQQLPPDAITSFWPTALHPVLQVCLLIVAMDFFRYWYHRWMHESPFMWRWHSVHHSSTRLYWFNGARSHPVEMSVSDLLWVIPFTLIQAPVEIVFVAGIVSRVIGRFQHTNIDAKLGPFEYVFSGPYNHRYHHSKRLEEGNSNYGGDIMLWDHLFGTFHLPKGKRPSDDIGLAGMPDYPQTWHGLMLAPFRWRMWRRKSEPASTLKPAPATD